jgi:hypothetical protein
LKRKTFNVRTTTDGVLDNTSYDQSKRTGDGCHRRTRTKFQTGIFWFDVKIMIIGCRYIQIHNVHMRFENYIVLHLVVDKDLQFSLLRRNRRLISAFVSTAWKTCNIHRERLVNADNSGRQLSRSVRFNDRNEIYLDISK